MGDSTSKLYRRWWSMNSRCNYPSASEYDNYGGRGITVCDEWHQSNPEGWHNFKRWMIIQGYDETLPTREQTIDRIDGNKGYSPSNCRLISNFEQQANTRKNVYLTYKGERHHISEWSRITGISKSGIRRRIAKGMSDEEVLTTPLKHKSYSIDKEELSVISK